jgi:predicted regulator of Ras-like GTPase activity (Roadblock/LC7/MglB family)
MLDAVMDEIASRTPGFQGATVMGTDGIPLAQRVVEEGPDLELFAAECSALLKTLCGLSSQEECGTLRGFHSTADRWKLLLERVTTDYFLLLVVTADASLGHCRYRLRSAALDLESELS